MDFNFYILSSDLSGNPLLGVGHSIQISITTLASTHKHLFFSAKGNMIHDFQQSVIVSLLGVRYKMKITKLETFLIAPRWLFLRVHTDEGIVGLGEPYLEGRATTSAEAVRELEDYLIGQDPR